MIWQGMVFMFQSLIYSPAAATLFYLAWATFALLATYGRRGKQQVGAVLFFCWATSWFLWSMSFPIVYRPAVFPLLDGLLVFFAWKAGRETGARAVPAALIILSLLAACGSFAFAWVNTMAGIPISVPWQRIALYELSLNAIFMLQCALVGGWGIADGVGRSLGIWHSGHRVRANAQPLGRENEAP